MLVCPNCKKEFEDGVSFCSECGSPLEAVPAPAPAPEPEPAPETAFTYTQPAADPEAPAAHPKKGLGICSLIFGILSYLCCWIPLISLVFPIVGLATGSSALKAGPLGTAKAGKILSLIALILQIVGIVITVVFVIIGIVGGSAMGGFEEIFSDFSGSF